MDSFHEPRRVSEPIKLEDLTAEVVARIAEYHTKGIPLSGRIIHVCHYLPIVATLHASSRPGLLSPPPTPPQQAADIPSLSSNSAAPTASDHDPEGAAPSPRWSLSTRQGHAAMISGIRSLSATHEQFVVGWVGDIEGHNPNSGMWVVTRTDDPGFMTSSCAFFALYSIAHPLPLLAGEKIKVPSTALSEEDKAALEEEIANFKSEDEDAKTTTSLIPLLLDDKVAHGHYDGYCKQSELFDRDAVSASYSHAILFCFPALWPLFHYLLWQDVSPNSLSASFSADEHWAPYEQANTAFARRIMDIYRPGDLVLVHDYHLLLVPKLLRLLVPDIYVGIFVHTPWPSSEVFRCLPREYPSVLQRKTNFLTFLLLRAEGDPGWHARCQPRMFPDLFVLSPFHVILRTSVRIRSRRPRYRCTRPRDVRNAHARRR
jgi:trehalose 6-phosphate synthase/phosphatase